KPTRGSAEMSAAPRGRASTIRRATVEELGTGSASCHEGARRLGFSRRRRASILRGVTKIAPALALALFVLGCDGPAVPDDAAPPDAPPCEATPFAAGTDEGLADPLGAGAGEVRAGRLSAAALPADPDGLARWREGDFVLANDRV